jgi:hypothetical protein
MLLLQQAHCENYIPFEEAGTKTHWKNAVYLKKGMVTVCL